jgi:RNA polymerase-binding transcription factor DksA
MSEAVPDLAHLDRVEAELADVARALERLDDGTYGTCEVCGAPLPDDLLATSPAVRACGEHTVPG